MNTVYGMQYKNAIELMILAGAAVSGDPRGHPVAADSRSYKPKLLLQNNL